MSEPTVTAVMVHVPSVNDGLAWYERAFPSAVRSRVTDPPFEFLRVGATRIELVPSDSRSPRVHAARWSTGASPSSSKLCRISWRSGRRSFAVLCASSAAS
jgi:hypothetical protein